jgi:cytochrome b
VHVPVPLVIVTVSPLIVQEPVAVIVGTLAEFDVADTVKLDWYAALAGAPVKLTVGFTAAATVVVSVTPGAAE